MSCVKFYKFHPIPRIRTYIEIWGKEETMYVDIVNVPDMGIVICVHETN